MIYLIYLFLFSLQSPTSMNGTYIHINLTENIYNSTPVVQVDASQQKIFFFDDHFKLHGSISLDQTANTKLISSEGSPVLRWKKEDIYTLALPNQEGEDIIIYYRKLPPQHLNAKKTASSFPERIVDYNGYLFFKVYHQKHRDNPIPVIYPIRKMTEKSVEYFDASTGNIFVHPEE